MIYRAMPMARWLVTGVLVVFTAVAVIEVDGRRPLLVPVRYGFGQLAQSIAAAAPQATVEQT
jgi:hypothetical protein